MTESYQRKPPAPDERGIYFNKGKWVVALVFKGKRYYGGRFTLKRAALLARDALLTEIKGTQGAKLHD